MRQPLERHIEALRACRACPGMHPPPVTGGAVSSRVMLVGQAPGAREPVLQRPFAWTAGKTLFGWFEDACGIDEERFRERVYIAAVCRCFPGKAKAGGDRVPNRAEIERCSGWLQEEFRLLRPELVLPVGRLAIAQFLPGLGKLTDVVGKSHAIRFAGENCTAIPLPHPSGASTWHRSDPGRTLTATAVGLAVSHPAFRRLIG